MTPTEHAIKAIKAATGWDAEPSAEGAKVRRPNSVVIYVWFSRSDKWKCEVNPHGWIGEGKTADDAIADVLPRYRAHVQALAVDMLPSFPYMEWCKSFNAQRLVLVVGKLRHTILLVDTKECSLSVYSRIGFADVYHERTHDEVLARVKQYVESLCLPCVLPAFPENDDAS